MRTTLLAGLAAAALLFAGQPAAAQTLEEAARSAARQNDAKVLSARTVKQGKGEVHQIRMLTPDGVVKTVNVQKGQAGKASQQGKRGNQGKKRDKGREDGD